MKIQNYLSAAAVALIGFSATAQDLTPEVVWPAPGSSVILSNLSDNGKWAVAETGSVTDGDLRPIGGVLYNMETLQQTSISHSSGLSGVSDVTDDGSIVVGECNGKPGYWSAKTNSWTNVKLPAAYDAGRFNAVTPDGHYAVGYFQQSNDGFKAYAMAYDLTTGEQIPTPGLPKLDMTHEDQGQNSFFAISPDGRYGLAQMSMSYLMPAALCCYVYDFQNDTYDFIGFNDHDDADWEPLWNDLFFIDAPKMSNDGLWVTGFAYMVTEIPGSEWANEAYHPFRYNVLTKEIEVYDDAASADIGGFGIDSNGVVYGATPAQNPYPNSLIRSGNYFISFDQIFKQVYNYDFEKASGYPNTGKVLAMSDDGLTLIMLPDTSGTYILRLKESLSAAASRVRLLDNYSVTPAEGVKLSRLTSITITFDRDVKIKGDASQVVFASADGSESYNPVANNGLVAEGKKVTVTFRSRNLNDGVNYTLTIPEGLIVINGDEDETNAEIKLNYVGRSNTPVTVTKITPEDDSYVESIDMISNPILLYFDADLKLVEGARGYVYRNDEETAYANLNIAVADTRALVYPTNGIELWEGTDYHFVIPANTVTDISGGGANEEIRFTYHGNKERVISASDRYIFEDDCTNYTNFMFYDGDNLEPDMAPAEWGFTKDTTPWYIVRDGEAALPDYAMASHSMYKKPGKSDDWMVTAQLLIPDSNCFLEFQGQSYLHGFEDYLDVYVYPCETIYNTIDAAFVKDVREKGKLVFHERLEPGDSEEGLEGDWQDFTVDLKEYADQSVYICFVNNNTDQSAIFVDNIHVVHDMTYYTSFETPQRVVNQNEVTIKGNLLFGGEFDNFKSIELVLLDKEANEIDKISESGLELVKGSIYDFEFSKPFPLALGETNTYYVDITLDGGEKARVTGTVSNLTFEPTRKIILEEYTGSECGNCPLGIRGMENIEMLYPGVMLPITIRTYQNDKLGPGMGAYSQYLGLDNMGAPSAIINRKEAAYPMIQSDGKYLFSGTGITNTETGKDERCWLDVFRSEYENPAELAVELKSSYDETTKAIDVEAQVTSALNKFRTSYNVFAVVVEDGLNTYQKNYLYNVNDPNLGEWGAGGKYASATVMPVEAHSVARQTWGTTYNGTNGLIPATLEAGKTYRANLSITLPESATNPKECSVIVMLIDAGTGNVMNANMVALNGETQGVGVENITLGAEAQLGMTVAGGKLYVNGEGNYTVNAYDMTGALIISAKGHGTSEVALNGYNGILIVKATDENGNSKSAKFVVR